MTFYEDDMSFLLRPVYVFASIVSNKAVLSSACVLLAEQAARVIIVYTSVVNLGVCTKNPDYLNFKHECVCDCRCGLGDVSLSEVRSAVVHGVGCDEPAPGRVVGEVVAAIRIIPAYRHQKIPDNDGFFINRSGTKEETGVVRGRLYF
jgi:hypothetical protein